jgi:hypothetical protein
MVTTAAAFGATLLGTAALAAPELPEGFISGTVESSRGAEAGVWVIAETEELKTPFIKIVVTDDRGRYVLPELPVATYNVWVRGYGLVDSAPVEGRPGDEGLKLEATIAGTPQEAARVYPGNYWLSLLEPPAASQFPGTGPSGNGISPAMAEQGQWIWNIKSSCNFCHQLGNEITRTLGHMDHLGLTPEEAWVHRTQTGVRGSSMAGAFAAFGRDNAVRTFAGWTNRVAAGDVPPAPPRPQGVERNVVLTLWDWGVEDSFMHDEIATDKNDPTVNAYGPIYAVSSGHGKLTVLDPIENDTYELLIPTREDAREVASRFPPPAVPSNFWGNEHLWGPEHPSDPHNPMLDRKGRVWMTSKIRNTPNPDWCRRGSDNKYAQYYPLDSSFRQASYYDPATEEFRLIDTCFATHHLQFDNDADQTLYFNELLGPIVGWVNTREYDRTGDEQLSQGWCPQIVDTNGDGRITQPWNAAGERVDPRRDTEVRYNLYAVIPSPVDGSVWGASEQYPGFIVRVDRGDNPPQTCVTEVYKVPEGGIDPRGIDIDSNGVVWTALAASSHLARFDRSKCTVTSGPTTLEGTHCPEGWTLFVTDGPRFEGTDVPSDFHYFNWVDQHDIAGFGPNTPMATGSNSDAILVLDPEDGTWTTLRVPYPLGFYQRGLDGRIDDPQAGWKGRALYANYGTHLVWHTEGGKGTLGKLVKFQIRPDPLAR